MRRLRATLVVAAAVAPSLPATAGARPAADAVPAPAPVLTKLGRTPLVELAGDRGGLSVLGAGRSADRQAALRAYDDSGLYARQLNAIGARARRWVGRFTRRNRSALVLDIDETTLSNIAALSADGFTPGAHTARSAADQAGRAIAPTLRLYRAARARGIAVFFVTGRSEAVRAPTAANLRREGFATWRGLTLKPAGFTGTTVAYKSAARRRIERRGFRIVANVGDQRSDLAGGHALRAFKYPNPFYFLP
jgi:HAD superfamily, subfamily IIIB (Acid phosphatase)